MSHGYVVAADQQAQKHLPGWSHPEMMADVGLSALRSVGLSPRDVDAVFATSGKGALAVSEHLGITASVLDSTMVGGASSLVHLSHAAREVRAGNADVVLVTHSGRNRSDREQGKPPTRGVWSEEFQDPFGIPAPIGLFAMCARAHMARFGTREEDFAQVAVSTREWGSMNPEALYRDPITVDDVLGSPMIADPLHLMDCCLVTDASGALVVTSEAVAEAIGGPMIRIAGSGQAHAHITLTQWDDLSSTAAGRSAGDAMREADVSTDDVDVLQLYDAVTSHVLIMLEDIGFADGGEGRDLVADGATRPGGSLPMNTQGGGLSFTHPGMFGIFTAIENFRQLSGFYEGTDRQVPDVEIGLAHAMGYIAGSHASVVMAKD